jgi:hypothetical protein
LGSSMEANPKGQMQAAPFGSSTSAWLFCGSSSVGLSSVRFGLFYGSNPKAKC